MTSMSTMFGKFFRKTDGVLNFIKTICITSFTISEDISLIIKEGQRYFVQFITTQLMASTPDCFHSMIDFLIILESSFIILVGNILFDHILF